MHSTMNPPLGNGYDEPARPAWTFQQRTVARAEPTGADEPPDDEPVAIEPAVTQALVELGEAHFWPHAHSAGDLSSPDGLPRWPLTRSSRVFFVSGGSEAAETAMKMAKKFHRSRGDAGCYKFTSRRGSYHGATHGALSLGGGGGNNGAECGPLP